jgi:UPF0755 protein
LPASQPSVKVPGPRHVKQRRSAIARVLGWTFLLLLAVILLAGLAGFYTYSEYSAPGPLAEDKVFMVDPGQSVTGIGEELQQNGIVSNGRVFALMAQLTGQRARLKAGEYAFPRGATMRNVMALIASGKAITYKISIPEGFTSQMAVERVNANEVLAGDAAAVPPEGSILPDTYVFRRGMTRQKLVEDMQTAQAKLLAELWSTRKPVPVIATPEQAVTLASIVEKETAQADERPVIASVFINRLEKGMRLQSDPTIIYGIAGGKGRLDRPLSKADIEAVTPYNTYRIDGLPPGPIANPGRAALEAVLNPEQTDKLYFVADGTGGHAFAATLEEHNRNVKNWRQIAGNAAAAAAADDSEEAAAAPAAPAATPDAVPATPPAAPATQAPLADATPEPEAPAPNPAPEASTPAPVPAPPPEAPAAAPAPTPPPAPPATPEAAAPAAPPPPAPQPKPEAAPPAVPKPQVKPPQPATAKPAAPAATDALKPGTVLTVGDHMTVIPRLRP